MESVGRFASDISSWYWWVSVVFVGLAINLASSYIKPPIDRWLERRSERRRSARERMDQKFDAETSRIAFDPTLLVLAGQAAASAETRTQLLFILVGVNLVLLFILTSMPEPKSGITTLVTYFLFASLPLHLSSVIKAMRDESSAEDRYRAARRKYRERSNGSFEPTSLGEPRSAAQLQR